MTYRAVGVPEIVEMLRMPEVRNRPLSTVKDLADALDFASRVHFKRIEDSENRLFMRTSRIPTHIPTDE